MDGYAYDSAGNRVSEQVGSATTSSTHNNLKQDRRRFLDAVGEVSLGIVTRATLVKS